MQSQTVNHHTSVGCHDNLLAQIFDGGEKSQESMYLLEMFQCLTWCHERKQWVL